MIIYNKCIYSTMMGNALKSIASQHYPSLIICRYIIYTNIILLLTPHITTCFLVCPKSCFITPDIFVKYTNTTGISLLSLTRLSPKSGSHCSKLEAVHKWRQLFLAFFDPLPMSTFLTNLLIFLYGCQHSVTPLLPNGWRHLRKKLWLWTF